MSKFWFFVCVLTLVSAPIIYGQQTSIKPLPDDETIRVSTEEVQLNVSAQNEYGHFDPTLVKDDLLVVEDGVPQTVMSLDRTPASVLFLLDTGLELNYAKNSFQTGITAEIILRKLQPADYFSIIQYNDKPEILIDWTRNRDEAALALDQKLFSGQRSRLVLGLEAALEKFKNRPLGNRHLVLITDGIESVAAQNERQLAFQKLLAASITVHVVSYTRLEDLTAQKATQRLKPGDGKTKPRVREEVMQQIIDIVPDDPRKKKLQRFMQTTNESQKLIIFEIDVQWLNRVRRQREAWRAAEAGLSALSAETGGVFQAPEDVESMFLRCGEITAAIDSNYVVTYIPKRSISDLTGNESRQLRIIARRAGLSLRSKQQIVLSH